MAHERRCSCQMRAEMTRRDLSENLMRCLPCEMCVLPGALCIDVRISGTCHISLKYRTFGAVRELHN